ncbi:MAG: TIGR01459 family HAD-type hydrolase [Rhodospirillales bacterium]|nr:TIGR01459 family HAD-type hydrolase [Rhodospirillales bacterium]
MEHLESFAPLASRYDGFILDLWGVIHDGVRPYPGAVDCLARLGAAGKRRALLSNGPRRNHVIQAAMRAMGIDDALYDAILTSGEATWLALRDRPDPWLRSLGERVFHLGPARDLSVVENLPLTRVATPAQASFVVNTGPDDASGVTELGPYEETLAACAARNLPMICANPDLEVIRDGKRVLCAGALAQRYEQMGGSVRYFGKPDPAVYALVLRALDVDSVLAVGDALRTDIAGAYAARLPACWVLGGIHAEEVGGDQPRIEAAARAAGLAPVATVPSFSW